MLLTWPPHLFPPSHTLPPPSPAFPPPLPPPSPHQVLDTGCLCLDSLCVQADCGGGGAGGSGPVAAASLPVYAGVNDTAQLHFDGNVYSTGACVRSFARMGLGAGGNGNP